MKKTPAAAAAAAPAPPAGAPEPARAEEAAPCDPAPAPAPVRDRSQYVAGTVIVLCIVALALGYIFTTADRAVPTSTAITTAGAPAQLETTPSTTTKAPDIPAIIICIMKEPTEDTGMQATMEVLQELCSKILVVLKIDAKEKTRGTSVEGEDTDEDMLRLQQMKNFFEDKLVIGINFQENQAMSGIEAIAETKKWKLTASHGIMEVKLTNESAQKVKDAATKLKNIQIMGLLVTSEVKATVDTIPSFDKLEVIIVSPKCEAYPWNSTLAYLAAINSYTNLAVCLSITAAIWKNTIPGEDAGDTCSSWQDSTGGVMGCAGTYPLEQCKKGMVVASNATIAAMVKYAKDKGINRFAILSAHHIATTAIMHRQFHRLRFSLPPVPAKNGLLPRIPLQQLGLDDSQASGSELRVVRSASITGSDAEPVGSGMLVEAAEHRGKSGVAKAASSKSAKGIKKPRSGSMASSVPPISAIHETKSRGAPHGAASTTSATSSSQALCEPAEGCEQT